MPNQRRDGWGVGSYSAPRDLIDRAREKARRDGTSLSAVIRAALRRYVEHD